MKKFFIILGVITAVLIIGYGGLHWWTTTYRDEPAHEWLSKLPVCEWVEDLFDDNKEEVSDTTDKESSQDETLGEDSSQDEGTEEVTVANEDGTVEATATINL